MESEMVMRKVEMLMGNGGDLYEDDDVIVTVKME